jgi:hypothetical protein
MDDIMIPEQAEAHRVTVDAYEEDFFLLENDMAIMKLFIGLGSYDYAMRMLDWDMHGVGRFWLEYSRLGIDRGLQARQALPSEQIYDVRLSDLRQDPLEVIEDIYQRFGLPFDSGLAEKLGVRIAEEPTAQLGEHDYDIADYGLTEDQIQATFADYRERFGV